MTMAARLAADLPATGSRKTLLRGSMQVEEDRALLGEAAASRNSSLLTP